MKRALTTLAVALCAMLASNCATDGTGGGDFYGGYYHDDWWYGGGCCVDYPGDIGPPAPRPEHPIAKPPAPSQPIAPSRPMPSPRPAAMPRGGGGRR